MQTDVQMWNYPYLLVPKKVVNGQDIGGCGQGN